MPRHFGNSSFVTVTVCGAAEFGLGHSPYAVSCPLEPLLLEARREMACHESDTARATKDSDAVRTRRVGDIKGWSHRALVVSLSKGTSDRVSPSTLRSVQGSTAEWLGLQCNGT